VYEEAGELLAATVSGIRAIPYLMNAIIVFCVERNTSGFAKEMYSKMRKLQGGQAHLYMSRPGDPNMMGIHTNNKLKVEFLDATMREVNRHNLQYSADFVCENPFMKREGMSHEACIRRKKDQFEEQMRNIEIFRKGDDNPFAPPRITWSGKRSGREVDDMATAFTMCVWLMGQILDRRATWQAPLPLS
jgi:hypothetical protein